MGRIEDDGHAAGFSHDLEAPHVDHEVAVAKTESAFAGSEMIVRHAGFPGRGDRLGDHVAHLGGRQELAFLEIDRLAAECHGFDEVGLAAQERWRLEHVDDGCDGLDLPDFVHVGQDAQAELLFHLGQDVQTLVHPNPSKARGRTAVGLVERRLVGEGDAGGGKDPFEFFGCFERELSGLDGTRAGDDLEGGVVAEVHGDPERVGVSIGWGNADDSVSACRTRSHLQVLSRSCLRLERAIDRVRPG